LLLYLTLFAGINVVDAYKLCDYHHIINYRLAKDGEHKMPVEKFAGLLSYQLIHNTSSLLKVLLPQSREAERLQGGADSPIIPSTITASASSASSTLTAGLQRDAVVVAQRVLTDAQGQMHHQCQYEVVTSEKSGKKSTKTRECSLCKEEGRKRKLVGTYCFDCQLSFCCITKWNPDHDCFAEHVTKIRRTSGRGGS
jgi:hypothetical protein